MRKQLVNKVSDSLDVAAKQVQSIFKEILDEMVKTLIQEGRLELRGFGIFTCKMRKQRKARNPRTGETVLVPKRKVISFKPATHVQRLLLGAVEIEEKSQPVPSEDASD